MKLVYISVSLWMILWMMMAQTQVSSLFFYILVCVPCFLKHSLLCSRIKRSFTHFLYDTICYIDDGEEKHAPSDSCNVGNIWIQQYRMKTRKKRRPSLGGEQKEKVPASLESCEVMNTQSRHLTGSSRPCILFTRFDESSSMSLFIAFTCCDLQWCWSWTDQGCETGKAPLMVSPLTESVFSLVFDSEETRSIFLVWSRTLYDVWSEGF